MDLKIEGRHALVCAASRGLGRACAMALAAEGVEVTITGRTEATIAATANEIRSLTGAKVNFSIGDISTEAGRADALAVCPSPDILINNSNGPPTGDFREWSREDWLKALDANMLAPIALIRMTIDSMIKQRFGRIINITSAAVKSPIPALGLSNGARSGLTGFVAGLARQVSYANVTINSLLPGQFLTDRLRTLAAAAGEENGLTVQEELDLRASHNPAKRLGDPAEFGAFCAFLCSSHSGYITGQNIILDGGSYQGTL